MRSAIAGEDRLGSVAVVDVPVDDRHPPRGAVGAQRRHRDRDVVEQAESAPAIATGMVAGRTNGGERHLGVPGDRRARRVDRRPGREPRRLHRPGHDIRIEVEPPAALGFRLAEHGDVLRVVDARQLRIGGRFGRFLDEPAAGGIADAGRRRLATSRALGMARRGMRIGPRIGQEQDEAGSPGSAIGPSSGSAGA